MYFIQPTVANNKNLFQSIQSINQSIKNQSLKGAVGVTLRSIISNVVSTRFGGQFPWKFLVLPHSGRGSCQLLLSIPERSIFSKTIKFKNTILDTAFLAWLRW